VEIEMTTIQASVGSTELIEALCRELWALAKREEDLAAHEAAKTPYWSPCPASVEGHRAAARAIRAELARLESGARCLLVAS
jgi:hypothetical protein